MEKISIVIPAHNEEKRIGKTLKEYVGFFSDLKKRKILDFEILIVLNACKDNTREVVEKYRTNEFKILEFKPGGKGFALIEGFKEAIKENVDYIGFVDADMSTSPEEYFKLIKAIDGYDGVVASRYVKGAIIKPKQPIQRLIVSRVFNFLVRVLFLMPYADTQCGAKIFKKEAMKKIVPMLGMTHWAFDIDLLYDSKKLGLRLKEEKTYWKYMPESKLNVKKASIQMFLSIIRFRIVNSPFGKLLKDLLRPVSSLIYWIVK